MRPLNDKEKAKGGSSAWAISGNKIRPAGGNSGEAGASYAFDNVFGPDWSSAAVYEATARNLLDKVVEGFNATVFAYGQTSSGKTHTMRGTPSEPGLIPLAVRQAFDNIAAATGREFLARVSYMEVNPLLVEWQPLIPTPVAPPSQPLPLCGIL